LASVVYALEYDVETTGEYVMGDSDTKLEARRIALEHAKRLAVEQIGTYLESETIIRNSRLEKDEIRSYASAILKTTVLSEGINLLSDKTTVFLIKIKAKVDTKILEQKINEIKIDIKRKEQLEKLQIENIKLLKDLEVISAQLRSGKTDDYKKLREKREILFERLDKNQNSISMTFEKGTLLNLALKSKNELDELKSKVDEFRKYYTDNLKYKLGEPEVTNKGEVSDISIEVETWVENSDGLLNLLNGFSTEIITFSDHMNIGHLVYNGTGIRIPEYNYVGKRKSELKQYHEECGLRLKVSVGKYYSTAYPYASSGVETRIYLKSSWRLTIENIPTAELSGIGSIDAEAMCQSELDKKIVPSSEVYPAKKSSRKSKK